MARKEFISGVQKFVPESVNYNGKPAQIWTRWVLVDKAWHHAGKVSLPDNTTRSDVVARFSELYE